jgi:hypothetical protein
VARLDRSSISSETGAGTTPAWENGGMLTARMMVMVDPLKTNVKLHSVKSANGFREIDFSLDVRQAAQTCRKMSIHHRQK